MRTNVFLRSTLRQPVRAICLLLIVALLTFAFVSKGAEYLLITQETEDLSSYYRSIGTLTTGSISTNLETDASEAAAWLEENPYVDKVDRVQSVSAVADIYNAEEDKPNPENMSADMYFYGTFVSGSLDGSWDADNEWKGWILNDGMSYQYSFMFSVDTVLAGYPEYLSEGEYVQLLSPMGWNIGITMEHYIATPLGLEMVLTPSAPYADLTDQLEELESNGSGKRYLLHAVNESLLTIGNKFSTDEGTAFTILPLTEDGLWYYPVEEGQEADFSDPALAGVAEQISLINDNQHALLFFGSEDVSSMPETQKDSDGAPVLVNTILTEGRWPDAQDNAEANQVCAIHAKLAAKRGLSVGDTLTVSFRELLDMDNAPYLCMPDDLERDETPASEAMTFEVVGIFETSTTDEYYYSYLYNYVYVPASALPQSIENTALLTPYCVSFILTSPEYEDQFIVETKDALADMGFQAYFLENNWDAFQTAAQPIRQSALYNALIFSVVLAVALCLVVFLYFRMRRRDLAIARALGVPVGQCIRQVSVPLLLIGLAAAVCGGCLGWRYTLGHAGQTLSAMSELIEESGSKAAMLSTGWLVLMLAMSILLLLVLTLGSAALTAKKPVLNQLQGSAAVKEKRTAALAEQGSMPAVPAPAGVTPAAARKNPAASAPAQRRGMGIGMTLRFVWRHISRARMKTALSILLAVVFTVALAAIRISIADNEEKIDWLYDNTPVEADLLYAHSDYTRLDSGFIQDNTLQAILDTGYVLSASPEGVRRTTLVLTDPATQEDDVVNWYIRSFEYEEIFLSNSGGGSAVSIAYFDGWDSSLFAADWQGQDGPIPAVLPQELYEEYQLQPGDTFTISCGNAKTFTAAGCYEGSVADMYNGTETPILIPLSAHRVLLNNLGLLYARARLVLDPAMNRELDMVETAVQEAASIQDMIQLQIVIWDQELKLAVAPLENSVELMRVLYPVILALSLLAAAGIAALFIMTSAKEAAILRVLGTSKLRSRIMLSLQQTFTTMAGLVVGILAILVWSEAAKPELLGNLMGASALCAILYLLAAVLGAAASSAAATAKNPLELLQVKE